MTDRVPRVVDRQPNRSGSEGAVTPHNARQPRSGAPFVRGRTALIRVLPIFRRSRPPAPLTLGRLAAARSRTTVYLRVTTERQTVDDQRADMKRVLRARRVRQVATFEKRLGAV